MRPLVTRRRLLVAGVIVAALGGAGAIVATRVENRWRLSSPPRFPGGIGPTETWTPPAGSPIPDGGCPAPARGDTPDARGPTRLAVIGDYGYAGPAEEAS